MNGAHIHIINASIFKSKFMLVHYEIMLVYFFYPGIRINTQHLIMIITVKFCIYFYFDHKSNG